MWRPRRIQTTRSRRESLKNVALFLPGPMGKKDRDIGVDVYQHPETVMDENAEFLTSRPIKVRMIGEC